MELENKHICENCETEHDETYGSGRFCSSKCARGFSTKNKRQEINQKVSNKLSSKTTKLCISCNIEIKKTQAKYCVECNKLTRHIILYDKLNISKNNLKEAEEIAFHKLYDLYFIKKLSKCVIEKEYGILTNTIYNFFKLYNIELRNLSEAVNMSIKEDRFYINSSKKYKSGEHITWDGKKVYYRSSYELDYCNYLDDNKINYEMESKRIEYFDTIQNKKRIAIPDFYLPDSNTIIEIKSKYTYDKRNMNDKITAYEKLGYNFKLILDKEGY